MTVTALSVSFAVSLLTPTEENRFNKNIWSIKTGIRYLALKKNISVKTRKYILDLNWIFLILWTLMISDPINNFPFLCFSLLDTPIKQIILKNCNSKELRNTWNSHNLSNLPLINDCNSSSQMSCCPRLALFGALSAASCMQIRLFSENPVHLVLQLV